MESKFRRAPFTSKIDRLKSPHLMAERLNAHMETKLLYQERDWHSSVIGRLKSMMNTTADVAVGTDVKYFKFYGTWAGETKTHYAAANGQQELMKLLIDGGVSFDISTFQEVERGEYLDVVLKNKHSASDF